MTIKEFALKELAKGVCSDEDIMNRYVETYMKDLLLTGQYSCIIKKGESIRKRLWEMKMGKGATIEEVKRVVRPIRTSGDCLESCEIFYKLK